MNASYDQSDGDGVETEAGGPWHAAGEGEKAKGEGMWLRQDDYSSIPPSSRLLSVEKRVLRMNSEMKGWL